MMNLKSALRISFVVFAAGVIAWVASSTDEIIQINSMTGASRTKTCRAFLFDTPWIVNENWVAESARRQGIRTGGSWRNLTVISTRGPFGSRGCSRAPASYILGGAGPDAFELESPAQMDQFVRDFTAADEPGRKKILRLRSGGSEETGGAE
ncbi:MAG: hypothetical protein ABIS50_00635 [Luteolibacter sp.]|uniref:hypothetical protein n=1 Tax=Luteolibacter sp. TaxID=1962973 RepID=UPI003267E743